MSQEKKPTAPEAHDGAMPIACTTVRIPAAGAETSGAKATSSDAVDSGRTVIPPRAD